MFVREPPTRWWSRTKDQVFQIVCSSSKRRNPCVRHQNVTRGVLKFNFEVDWNPPAIHRPQCRGQHPATVKLYLKACGFGMSVCIQKSWLYTAHDARDRIHRYHKLDTVLPPRLSAARVISPSMSEGAAGICIDILCGVFGAICLDFASVRASFAQRRLHPPHQTYIRRTRLHRKLLQMSYLRMLRSPDEVHK